MYHPDKYDEHNKALLNLIKIFNNSATKKGSKVEMYYQENENYRDDGGIIYNPTSKKVLYDFEKRHKYYKGCEGLTFKTLGQFERKIAKEEIKLSIQCSTNEQCFVIAWHEDYTKEEKAYIKSETADGKGEKNAKRFTQDFIEIPYTKMDNFYDILLYAFENNSFNKKSFSAIKKTSSGASKTPDKPICATCGNQFAPRTVGAKICIQCWKAERGYN